MTKSFVDNKICSSTIGAYFPRYECSTKKCHFKRRKWSKMRSKVPVFESGQYEGTEDAVNYSEVYEWLGAQACQIKW